MTLSEFSAVTHKNSHIAMGPILFPKKDRRGFSLSIPLCVKHGSSVNNTSVEKRALIHQCALLCSACI
jgi:hypothetical protein